MKIVDALKEEAARLAQQIDTINGAIKALGGDNPNTRNGRKHRNGQGKRHFSAAARKRMSLAAQKRWAAKKAAK